MRLRAALLCSLGLLLVACSSAGVPADAQSSPEKVVESFFSSYMAGDRDAALSLVEADSRALLDGQLEGMESEGWVYNSVTVQSTDGNEVTVQMELTIDGEEDSGTDQVEVVEQDGKWWIVDLPS
jgi:hypothetical protein